MNSGLKNGRDESGPLLPKKIAILGSTGSIGVSALEVVRKLGPSVQVTALAAGRNVRRLASQIKAFHPRVAALADTSLLSELCRLTRGTQTRIVGGDEGVLEASVGSGAEMVLSAIVGAAGLKPTYAAVEKGLDIALANKETLVMAGEVMTKAAVKSGSRILPVDSEHCAVHQCLAGRGHPDEIYKIILTASGGPFRERPASTFRNITVAEALKHPTWSMGPKITIDSATLMNKGLEVIEAHFLFQAPYSKIDVVVHPESVVHSMVEFVDGAVLAQLGTPSMKLPIQYALTWPRRVSSPSPRLDLTQLKGLHFQTPDQRKFPCLELAYEAGKKGGTAPAVLNAANEVAVAKFLAGEISFVGIPRLIEKVLSKHRVVKSAGLSSILAADQWARVQAATC
jgi:1-deoxy-D-xylulose-5-phosphate reductoisomerase